LVYSEIIENQKSVEKSRNVKQKFKIAKYSQN